MSDIAAFFASLPSTNQDALVRRIQALAGQTSPDQIRKMEDAYERVREKIRAVNEKRDEVRREKEGVDAVLIKLDLALAKKPTSVELLLFKTLLRDQASKLEEEIALRQPYKSLKRKARLRLKIDQAKHYVELLSLTGVAMKNGK